MVKQVPLKAISHLTFETISNIKIQPIKTIASKKINILNDIIRPKQANTPITIQETMIVFTFLEDVVTV
jgi:hypothetical protein